MGFHCVVIVLFIQPNYYDLNKALVGIFLALPNAATAAMWLLNAPPKVSILDF